MTSLSRIYKSYTTSNDVVTLKDDEDVVEYVNVTETIPEERVVVEDVQKPVNKEKTKEEIYKEANLAACEIIDKAKMKAEEIIADAEAEGKRRMDELIIQGNKELGLIQQEGYRAGFEAKEKEVMAMLDRMNQTLDAAVTQLKESEKNYQDEVEVHIRELVIEMVEKILHKQIQNDPLALSCLIFEKLDELKKSAFVNVVLSNQAKELIALVEKEFIENEKYQGKYTVESRDVPEDTVLLEHESGVMDASISSQIKKLKDFFEV